jgi:hypothetical protein
MNSNARKLKLKRSRRNKIRKKSAQLELLNAKKKTLEFLDREGKLPKIVKTMIQQRKTA